MSGVPSGGVGGRASTAWLHTSEWPPCDGQPDQARIEAELTAVIGAAPNQRTQSGWPSATGTGLGCWRPRQGIWSCGFPSCLPAGSFLASRLERRRGLDQALFAVVMQAYLHGVPTGKVDDLVRAWVLIAVAPRARCRGAAPTLRRGRRVPGCKARVNRRVVCQAVVVATGVAGDGHTEVLGLAVGDSAEELLACTSFPVSHWKQLWSTNPWKGCTRRSSVAPAWWGVPQPEALLRLAGAVLVEAHAKWQVSDCRYLSEASMAVLTKTTTQVAPAELLPA